MVTAPDQHEGEGEDDDRALEDRAQGPGRDVDLDDADQRHQGHTKSVQLPPRRLHGFLLPHEKTGRDQGGAKLSAIHVNTMSTSEFYEFFTSRRRILTAS